MITRLTAISDLTHERSNLVEIGILAFVLVATTWRVGDRYNAATVVGLVFLKVSVQIRLLSETPLAQGTLERSLLVVYIPNVPLQIARYAERSLAIFALVRLLAGMGA